MAPKEDLREKAIHLFEFLKGLSEFRSHTIRDVNDYDEVLWVSGIPHSPGCFFIGWDKTVERDNSGVWIEIQKPQRTQPPPLPPQLISWVDPATTSDSSLPCPTLSVTKGNTEEKALAEKLLGRYVQDLWKAWAEQDKQFFEVEKIYKQLFYIYQQQTKLNETFELVLGIGLFTWRSPTGYSIRRHLLTAKATLSFDPRRGVLFVGPAAGGTKFLLDQAALDFEHRITREAEQSICHLIDQVEQSVWSTELLFSILNAYANATAANGKFVKELEMQKETSQSPLIHFAPALILRQHSERALLRFYDEIIGSYRDGKELSEGVRRLVSIVEEKSGEDIEKTELFFPLPANEEQREIVKRIETQQGVLVQGPPGTGKSHTIANLVCHLLARGNRVLVTSHTARALRVLKAKIPRSLTALCVQLLGDDRDAMKSLEESVQGIIKKSTHFIEGDHKLMITELEENLDQLKKEERDIFSEIRKIRSIEKQDHKQPFYEGTPVMIAERLREEEIRFGWIPDELNEDPVCSDEQISGLLKYLRGSSVPQQQELQKQVVDIQKLPDPSEFRGWILEEREAKTHSDKRRNLKNTSLFSLASTLDDKTRESLCEQVRSIVATHEYLTKSLKPWVVEMAQDIVAGREKKWRHLRDTNDRHLSPLRELPPDVFEMKIQGIKDKSFTTVLTHAKDLFDHLNTKRGLGFGPFRAQAVKQAAYIIKAVSVNGRPCNDAHNVKRLVAFLEVQLHLEGLENCWKTVGEMAQGTPSQKVAQFEDCFEPLENGLRMDGQFVALRARLSSMESFKGWQWSQYSELEELFQVLVVLKEGKVAQNMEAQFERLKDLLSEASQQKHSHPIHSNLSDSIDKRDSESFRVHYSALRKLIQGKEQASQFTTLITELKKRAPKLCSQLEQTCRDAVWDERLPHFEAAWKWKRTDQWLRTLADPTPMEQNFLKLRNVRKSISDLLEKLAAELAWGHCFGRLTETERQHLTAWEKAMQRFGKGTGIHSSQHVREAQNHMVHCRSAIPAWIMPLYRVVETLRPNHDRFDVVIIDEASQSGPDALFLFEIGKKIIVVGDDKQIAPDPIGVRREEVEKLRSTYLRGIPCSDAIGVDNSLFDFAEIRFGGRIRLREHFRCMPEIIEFSNRLCYGTEPLIPLREYGSERLEPSVKSIYLPHSEQKGSSSLAVNLSEAKAIVKEIGCCLKDKRYDGKSFGVISLLGGTQAKLIWKKLINEISAEELEARQLTCGDAYAFQGDERDVMFLSMVSAPNDGHRIGTLADAKSERRFNVAVSRARDQVLLFHSVTEEDLHPSCLRLKLLSYFKNPQIPQVLEESLNSAEIKQLASGPRKKLRPPVPFNSWLEVDVFLAIHEKGYRVYPQFNVARYRIDLVIQGGKKGRLAVECDADREETDKQQDEDVARQRDLETCGWTFWRISPSWFYRNPKAALEPLWRKLEDLDIQAEISSSQLQRKAA